MRQRIRPLLVLSAFFALASRVVPTAEEGTAPRAPGANAASAGGHFGMRSSLVPFAGRFGARGDVEPACPPLAASVTDSAVVAPFAMRDTVRQAQRDTLGGRRGCR